MKTTTDLQPVKSIFKKLKILLTIFSLFLYINISCQNDEVYIVTVETLNVRSGPGTNYDIVKKLKKGKEVIVKSAYNNQWYQIDIGFEQKTYVSSKLLSNDPNWNKKYHTSGSVPECENIKPEYDNEIDNYLKVNVGTNTDVVIKLMKINNNDKDHCIRMAYIRSNETYVIKNIPEGRYYLKIAYGKDWRQKTINEKCYGKFMIGPIYEKGDEILDYNLIEKDDYYDVPSFELSLDIVYKYNIMDEFDTDKIDEEEFNE